MSALGSIKIGAWVAFATLLLFMVALLSYQYFIKGTDNQYMSGMKIGEPFKLIDHNGDTITEEAFSGKPTAVFFGFTHCPEVCPTTLYELAGWLEALGANGKEINSYFITIDPERDTPQVMKSYVQNFTDRIVGITGSPKDVLKLAKSWHVYWKKSHSMTMTIRWTIQLQSFLLMQKAISKVRSPLVKAQIQQYKNLKT
jgi:protein SCO1/2